MTIMGIIPLGSLSPQAARDAFHDQRVVMVYQPHRFTGRQIIDEFVSVLGEASF